jgi:hypothetical protein
VRTFPQPGKELPGFFFGQVILPAPIARISARRMDQLVLFCIHEMNLEGICNEYTDHA